MEVLATVNRRALAAASLFQAKNDLHVYLEGVHIRPSGSTDVDAGVIITATDGHKIINIYDPHGSARQELTVHITGRVATAMKGAWSLTHAEIVGDEELGTLIRIPDDGYVSSVRLVEGKFPKAEALFPASLPPTSNDINHLNPKYFAALGAASKCLSLSEKYQSICIIPQPRHSISLFAFPNCSGDMVARAGIMPLRDGTPAADCYKFPSWYSAPSETTAEETDVEKAAA